MAPRGRTGTLRITRRWLVGAALLGATMSSTLAASAAPHGVVPVPVPVPVSGPDVSRWNHPNGVCIDWRAVAVGDPAVGVPPRQFAFIKATEGSSYTNPYFASCAGHAARGDWTATATAGLAHAAYHYAKPNWPLSDAVDEATFFVSQIGDQQQPGTLAPVLDLEENKSGLSQSQLIQWTQTWLDTVRRQTGRIPIIYTYPNFWATSMAGSQAFHAYPIWMADYRIPCSVSDIGCYAASGPQVPVQGKWQQWSFWQFTSSSPQPGIKGRVDMSLFGGDAAALSVLADGTQPLVWTPVAPAPPVKIAVTAGVGSARVTWLPGDNGGDLVTSYVVTASDGHSVSVGGTASSATVKRLTNGSPYTFTVRAVSDIGVGVASPTSKVVVPQVPTGITAALSKSTIVYGDQTVMTGTLIRTDTGAALSGQNVVVWQRPTGMTAWTRVSTVVTDARGLARWPFTPLVGTDTRMTFRPPAGTGFKPATAATRAVIVTDVPVALTVTPAQSTVRPGTAVTLSVRLARTDTAAPLPGAAVVISTLPAGTTTWVPAATVLTDATGMATWTYPADVTTVVQLSWAPTTPHWAPATATTTLAVKPAVTASLSAPTVRMTHAVTLAGHASTVLAGRRIYEQRWYRGAWKNVASQVLTDTASYSFVVTPMTRGTYRYRVVVPARAAYLVATSRVRVLVSR